MEITQVLTMILAFLVMTIMILGFIYWYISFKAKNQTKETEIETSDKKGKAKKKTGEYTKLSIHDFMKFDGIEDNMIIQKNGSKYLMVIECEGINYDLMSGVEKASVESGFIQFLNTLRHPIQIYTQTRTLKIESSIQNYKMSIDQIKQDLDKKQKQYSAMVQNGNFSQKQLQDARIEMLRVQNLYDYGADIIHNIEQLSQNKNVLRKHYYIIVPYYAAEIDTELFDEEEKRSMIFSELYTRSQSIIRTLFACSMKCKILDSTELAELLYISYNRDDSEIFGIDKAIKSGYDELYTTAPDVLDKKMQELDKAIEAKAEELARKAIDEVRTEREKAIIRKEQSFDDIVKEMAEVFIKENKKYLGNEITEKAIEKVKGEQTKEEGGNVDEQKTKKRAGRPTKTA